MSWDPTRPLDSDKLRISAGLIRDNFQAIQDGEVPFDFISLSEQAVDPTRIENSGFIYTKEVNSQSELFYEDDRATPEIIQLTNSGGIGNSAVDLYANRITFNDGTTFLDKNKQVLGWLRVNSAGTATATSGDMTVAHTGTGLYTVSFNISTVSAYVALVTLINTTSRRSFSVQSIAAGSFVVRVYSNSTGDNEDEPFHVIVFGGR